ncbi:hypothetical protein Hanom_Chr04g00344711 [Helianthus anomalus]
MQINRLIELLKIDEGDEKKGVDCVELEQNVMRERRYVKGRMMKKINKEKGR